MGTHRIISLSAAILLALVIVPLVSSDYGFQPVIYGDIPVQPFAISHNLILGRRVVGDRLLFNTTINVSRSYFRTVTKDLKYPQFGTGRYNLTFISVIDLKTDGTGGYPSLVQGGIGIRNATIKFISQKSHGLHFNVTMFGK